MSDIKLQSNWLETFYNGLQSLVDSTFPKKCNNCGKIYKTKHDFLSETIPVKDISLEDKSGLFEFESGDVNTTIGVFRNCKCGTTLMADFQDRRENSALGQSRRNKFKKLMDALVEHGVESGVARREILGILRGNHSEIIEEMLGDIKLH
jgi:hypothetical protein